MVTLWKFCFVIKLTPENISLLTYKISKNNLNKNPEEIKPNVLAIACFPDPV